jgi:biotin carboxyl carrier protein
VKRYNVTVNGNKYQVEVEEVKGAFEEVIDTPKKIEAKPKKKVEVKKSSAKGEKITCPMPGKLLKVNKKTGDSVKKGDVLFILEAMKMENEIMASCDGTLVELNGVEGAMVNTGDVLAVIG